VTNEQIIKDATDAMRFLRTCGSDAGPRQADAIQRLLSRLGSLTDALAWIQIKTEDVLKQGAGSGEQGIPALTLSVLPASSHLKPGAGSGEQANPALTHSALPASFTPNNLTTMKKILLLTLLLLSGLFLFAQSAARWRNARFVWDPNTELDLAGYNFYYGLVGGPTNVTFSATNTVTLFGLNNSSYWFAVTAVTTNGLESGLSNVILATVPKIPSNVKLQNQ